jgi:hypothetical protein
MLPALLLPHTCAAASPSYDTMGSHRAGSGVRLGVYLGDMGLKTIAMSNLPAMTALALLELQASLFRVRHGSTARATRGARTDHRTRCTPSVGAHAEHGEASAATPETCCGAVRRPALRTPPRRRTGSSSERSPYLYFSGDHRCTRCEREGLRTRVAFHPHHKPR